MIEPGKSYTTRDGFPVRIIATDAKGRFPIVGLVDMVNAEYARHWTEEGKAATELKASVSSGSTPHRSTIHL
jgi:hypothetical protein